MPFLVAAKGRVSDDEGKARNGRYHEVCSGFASGRGGDEGRGQVYGEEGAEGDGRGVLYAGQEAEVGGTWEGHVGGMTVIINNN